MVLGEGDGVVGEVLGGDDGDGVVVGIGVGGSGMVGAVATGGEGCEGVGSQVIAVLEANATRASGGGVMRTVDVSVGTPYGAAGIFSAAARFSMA